MKVGYYKIKQKEPPQQEPIEIPQRVETYFIKREPYDYFEYDECYDILILFIAAIFIIFLR